MADVPQHLRLDRLLFPDPVAAGLNPLVLFSLAYVFRGTNEDVQPITVRADVDGDYYRIVDGRHRALASMIAGRKTVLGVIE